MKLEGRGVGRTKNGLAYYLLPAQGFLEKTAAILVKRGANHLFWKGQNGAQIAFPKGTAHFIEHKLFQQEWGDAFLKFTQNGASANAFTDGDKTVYYFTCREKFMENLKLLLDFVQKPFFTDQDTEREKGIIKSEIAMYEDDPDWIGYYQLLEGMYASHPIKNKIAGTAGDVEEITAETLKQAYDAYYTTEQMALICTGEIPMGQVLAAAERVARKTTDLRVYFPMEGEGILEKYKERQMGLSLPHFQIGFKLHPAQREDWLRRRLLMGLSLELWAGESSPFFQKAYERGLLDEPLGNAFFCGEGYAFAAFSGNGSYPEEVAELLGQELKRLQREGVQAEDFWRIRKKKLGQLLRRQDSPLSLAMGQIEWAMQGASAAEILDGLKRITRAEAEEVLQNAFSLDAMALSVVR